MNVYVQQDCLIRETGTGTSVREATPDEKRLWAEIERLQKALKQIEALIGFTLCGGPNGP